MSTVGARPGDARREPYKLVILGAGIAGLCMGLRLRGAGERDFLILEKAGRAGGTWRENTYPGSGCDVPSHVYSYSFEPNPDWPEIYSEQKDILAYVEAVADRGGLGEHIRFDSEVVEAIWDDAALLWRIATRDGLNVAARAFVAAWGQLNRPKWPPIPAHETFAGTSFHSAQWDHAATLAGRRVAVIGNGASAVQFTPRIAPIVETLTLFQRSPNWIVPRLNRPFTEEERTQFRLDPAVMLALRNEIFDMAEARLDARRTGMQPPGPALDPLGHLHEQVADPDLRARLTPDYEVGCKRVLISNDFYPALTRPNVELVTDAIASITPQGVVDVEGRTHPADVIIYATGFETRSFVGDIRIEGAGGRALTDAWREGPEAYLGISVAGFPNLFILYGPNTNLGHNSIIFMIEAQVGYVLQALDALEAYAAKALDVQAEVMERYNVQLQADLALTPWAGDCTSWYKTPQGRILNNWPHSARQYAETVARFDPDLHSFMGAGAAALA